MSTDKTGGDEVSELMDRIESLIAAFDEDVRITGDDVVDLLEDCRNSISDMRSRLASLEGQEPASASKYRRWSFEADEEGLTVCRGDHDNSEHCEPHTERLSPHEALQIVNEMRADLLRLSARPAPPAADYDLWSKDLEDRDGYHEWADRLADAIASHMGVDIGEHSSANNPWALALEAIEADPPAVSADRERLRIDLRKSLPGVSGDLIDCILFRVIGEIEASIAPPAVPEWQPITSVPTDGQWIRGRTLTGTIIDKLRFTALGHWWWEPAGKEIYRPGAPPEIMLRDAGLIEWMPMPAPQREGGAE